MFQPLTVGYPPFQYLNTDLSFIRNFQTDQVTLKSRPGCREARLMFSATETPPPQVRRIIQRRRIQTPSQHHLPNLHLTTRSSHKTSNLTTTLLRKSPVLKTSNGAPPSTGTPSRRTLISEMCIVLKLN